MRSTDFLTTVTWKEFESGAPGFTSKLNTACQQGLFLLEIPERIRRLIPQGRQFASEFYKRELLRSKELPGFSGFNQRPNDQIESFYANMEVLKSKDDPELSQALEPVVEIATALHELATDILGKAREVLDVPEQMWAQGTSEGHRQSHFSVNHYRSHSEASTGLKAHKDIGFITVLDAHQPGLQIRLDEKDWVDLPPTEGHLIVLFDRALEVLIGDPNRLQACVHRVIRQESGDRTSLAHTLDGRLDGPVYQILGGELSCFRPDYETFMKECFTDIYV